MRYTCWIIDWDFFSFINVMPLLYGFHSFRWEICCHLNCFFLLENVSCCSQDFILSFVFRSLTMSHFGIYFFGYMLFGVCSALWICRFLSFAKFGRFSAIISLSTNFIFLYSSDKDVRSFEIVPQVADAQLIFFSLFILYCSDWVASIFLFSSSPVLSSVPSSSLLLSLSIDWNFAFFNSKISIMFFFIFYILCSSILFLFWDFSLFFICFKCVWIVYWSIFMIAALKISDNSNIFVSMLATINCFF